MPTLNQGTSPFELILQLQLQLLVNIKSVLYRACCALKSSIISLLVLVLLWHFGFVPLSPSSLTVPWLTFILELFWLLALWDCFFNHRWNYFIFGKACKKSKSPKIFLYILTLYARNLLNPTVQWIYFLILFFPVDQKWNNSL